MGRLAAVGFLCGLALLVVVDALATRVGIAAGVIPTLAGPALWTISRAAGVTAFLALTLDVVFGLCVSTGAADRWLSRARSVEVHRWLSSVALALTAAHALALVGDRVVRFDVLDVLIPFLSSYRSLAVGVGVLAAHGALVVHVSFGLRRRLGPKTWRRLHYLSFAVFVAALAHGVLAGSDSGRAGVQALYLVAAGAVALLVLLRLSAGRGRWLKRGARPPIRGPAGPVASRPMKLSQRFTVLILALVAAVAATCVAGLVGLTREHPALEQVVSSDMRAHRNRPAVPPPLAPARAPPQAHLSDWPDDFAVEPYPDI